MSTTLPSDATKVNCDSTADDPKLALTTDLAGVVDKFNLLKAAIGSLGQLQYGNGFAIETLGAGVADKLHSAIATLTKSAAYTVLAADRGKLIDNTGTYTLTFTATATLGDNWFCYVRNSDTGTITLDPNLAELIDGVATISLAAGETCMVQCNGTALKTVGRTVPAAGVGSAIINNTTLTLTSATHNTHIIRCTVASAVYTFPDAAANSGMYFWIDNATSSDTGTRLLSNGGLIGGAAAAGATNYVPAYTVIAFQSDGTNWIVFDYAGKTVWTFTANGAWYCPPGKTSGVGTVVGSGGSGGGSAGIGNTGNTTSIGALLTATGSAGGILTAGTVAGGTPNGGYGWNNGSVTIGGGTPFGNGGIRGTSIGVDATGYGSGGTAGSLAETAAGGGGFRIKESISPVPGTAYTITIGAGGIASGTAGSGKPGIAMVELN